MESGGEEREGKENVNSLTFSLFLNSDMVWIREGRGDDYKNKLKTLFIVH